MKCELEGTSAKSVLGMFPFFPLPSLAAVMSSINTCQPELPVCTQQSLLIHCVLTGSRHLELPQLRDKHPRVKRSPAFLKSKGHAFRQTLSHLCPFEVCSQLASCPAVLASEPWK